MSSKLVCVGWSELEWVWRGYIFGYKTPILTFSEWMGSSSLSDSTVPGEGLEPSQDFKSCGWDF